MWHRFHAGDDTGGHSKGFSSARIAARYVSKYIGKAFDDGEQHEANENVYRRSLGFAPVPRKYGAPDYNAAIGALPSGASVHQVVVYGFDNLTGEILIEFTRGYFIEGG
jgi:hypothetical protein